MKETWYFIVVLVLAGQMAEHPKSPELLSKLRIANVWFWVTLKEYVDLNQK